MTSVSSGDGTTDGGGAALLVMDYQWDVLASNVQDPRDIIGNTNQAIAAARDNHLPVVHVVVRFRAGYPEVSPWNRGFRLIAANRRFAHGSEGADIHPDVAVRPPDLVVEKHRVSAFAHTDLDLLLRSQGVRTLYLAGVATSGVVLSTVRAGADLDYQIHVLRDCCADPDAEVHRVLMDGVFPRQADVVVASDVTTLFQRHRARPPAGAPEAGRGAG